MSSHYCLLNRGTGGLVVVPKPLLMLGGTPVRDGIRCLKRRATWKRGPTSLRNSIPFRHTWALTIAPVSGLEATERDSLPPWATKPTAELWRVGFHWESPLSGLAQKALELKQGNWQPLGTKGDKAPHLDEHDLDYIFRERLHVCTQTPAHK